MINSLTSGGYKSSPVIAFDVLVDIDLALVKYCITHNMKEIDYDMLKTINYYQLIGLIYRRKDYNPLTVIAKKGIDSEYLDSLQSDVISKHQEEILTGAIYTDIHQLIKEFVKSSDISPYILCYNDLQKSIIEDSDLRNIITLDINSAKHDKTQYYLKYLSDIDQFNDTAKSVTYYVSSCGLNLNDTNDDLNIDREKVLKIATNRSKISIFDMYRMDIIGSYNKI